MAKNKKATKKASPVLSLACIKDACGQGVWLNPISRSLNAITTLARDESLADRPAVLVKIGAQLNDLVPEGYEECFAPPLTAKQLKRFLADDESVSYVRDRTPRTFGVNTLKTLEVLSKLKSK